VVEVRPGPTVSRHRQVACFRPSRTSGASQVATVPRGHRPASVRARSIHMTISTHSKAERTKKNVGGYEKDYVQ